MEEKKYVKKPIVVKAYQTNEEIEIETLEGTMKANPGDFIITGVAGEKYPCKPEIFWETYEDFDDEDTSIEAFVLDNLYEWSRLITELSENEIELFELKEKYELASEKIIDETDFKAIYGKNNAEVRKQHVKSRLYADYLVIKDLEFSIDYLKRRISYLKQLIHTKTVLREVKE